MLLLAGCATDRPETPEVVGVVRASFIYGSDRKAVLHELEEVHATILQDTPALIFAQYDTPKMKKHPQVRLHFDARGRLVKIEDIWSQ